MNNKIKRELYATDCESFKIRPISRGIPEKMVEKTLQKLNIRTKKKL